MGSGWVKNGKEGYAALLPSHFYQKGKFVIIMVS